MPKTEVVRTLALNVVLAAAYVLLGRLTFAASVEYGNVTSVVFAPEGVALAFCILWGRRMAPGIVLGQALLSYWSGPSVLGGVGIGLFNAAEGVLGGWLFHRWGLSRRFDRPRDVLLFMFMVVCILQPISATGGVLVLLGIGMAPPDWVAWLGDAWWVRGLQKPLPVLDLVPAAWAHWWAGNTLGQLLFAPLVLAWCNPRDPRTPLRGLDRVLLALGALVAAALLLYSDAQQSWVLLLVLSYPFFLWLGVRFGLRTVTLANVAVAWMAVVLGVRGAGFMQYLALPERLFYASVIVAIVTSTSLVLFGLLEERSAMIEELRALASIDVLTRASSRRHFMQQAEIGLARARRRGVPLCLAMLDLDHFKQVNDTHGHAAGDRVLRMLGRSCRVVLRASDLVGRMGGEEFALLLADADSATACAIVERLLERVRAEMVPGAGGAPIRVSFSAGVACMKPQEPLESLLERADAAMYRAKQAGRDRVWLDEGG